MTKLGLAIAQAGAETLVLTLLHTLGAALFAAGLAVFALLHQTRRTGSGALAVTALAVAAVAEGANVWGMHQTDSAFYLYPLACLGLVALGLGVWAFAGGR